ncbi:MAG: radical SAM family heme chaperone HemW [Planctomycetales bacterium]|nr:radical SAM family heme chaperone HemW [Planctomycetales bacterium]
MVQSAYIHVPFCQHRCGYCNFSLAAGRGDLVKPFLNALEVELSQVLGAPRPMSTVFLGGGTPTYLCPKDLSRLLELCRYWLPVTEAGEFSCEANPVDCSPDILQVLQKGGVNRLSLGGQSFQNHKLHILERDHSPEELTEAVGRCLRVIPNTSLDLIFAVPGETLPDWKRDLAMAVELDVPHVSTYGLTIERGSRFFGRLQRHEFLETTEDQQLAMYEVAIEQLTRAGLQHYEVSNFAKNGFACRHNEAYWLGESWWAFGPSGAAFLPVAGTSVKLRTVNHASVFTYIKRIRHGQSPLASIDEIDLQDQVRERLVFGLRRMQGVSSRDLDSLWGGDSRTLFEPHLSEYICHGLIQQIASETGQGSHFRLSRKGLMVSDSLWPNLLARSIG